MLEAAKHFNCNFTLKLGLVHSIEHRGSIGDVSPKKLEELGFVKILQRISTNHDGQTPFTWLSPLLLDPGIEATHSLVSLAPILSKLYLFMLNEVYILDIFGIMAAN